MTQNKNNAAMRYAARLTCIYDWSVYQDMDRVPERMTKSECIETIRKLWDIKDNDESVLRLWNIVGNMFPGTGNDDIEQADKWVLPELVRNYDMQKREILATQRLREVFNSEDDLTIFDVERLTGTYCWEFNGWLDFRNRIPWLVVQAVENLDATKRPWKTLDVFRERDRLKKEFNAK